VTPSPSSGVVLDFETTGTIAPGNRVIEIGAVRVARDSTIGASWDTVINPARNPGHGC